MPRSTAEWPFEFRLLAWADGHCLGTGFLLTLDADGREEGLVEGSGESALVDRALVDAVKVTGARYVFFDPFDKPEYAWLEWRDFPQHVFERLLGEPLEGEVPATWSVML
jgi:hypothetical protein